MSTRDERSGTQLDATVARVDGRQVRMRPIGPGDAPALVRFHEGLSDETTRLRFFTRHPHLSRAEVAHFTDVDHHDREAVVMTALDEIVGVGRYDRSPGSPQAEVAFVVSDAWQGHGAASLLFSWLVVRAGEEGVTRFVADTLGDNHRMLQFFHRTGLVTTRSVECGVIHLSMALPPSVGHHATAPGAAGNDPDPELKS